MIIVLPDPAAGAHVTEKVEAEVESEHWVEPRVTEAEVVALTEATKFIV